MTQPAELTAYVDAFEQSLRSILTLLDELEPEDWQRPTDLPGWRVRDVVAHVAALESELIGEPVAAEPEEYGPHVRDDFGRHMERGVLARSALEPATLVAELRRAFETHLPQMRRLQPDTPPPVVVADRGWDTTELLRNRAFDTWMHEQDLRRAVTRPGNLDGPGARIVRAVLLHALPYLVAKRALAVAGQSIRVVTGDPVPFDLTVAVGEDGRAGPAETVAPTVTVTAEWQTWVRLLGGRMSPADAVVELDGDRELGQRLVDRLAITP